MAAEAFEDGGFGNGLGVGRGRLKDDNDGAGVGGFDEDSESGNDIVGTGGIDLLSLVESPSERLLADT